jgi:hypothetical protein
LYSPAQLAPSRSGDELTISVAALGAPLCNWFKVLLKFSELFNVAKASDKGAQRTSYVNAIGTGSFESLCKIKENCQS